MKSKLLPFLFLLLLALPACSSQEAIVLPKGEQTLRGELRAASLSMSRRGTHVLFQNGTPVCYIESSTVSLHSFEDETVELTGTFEPNSDSTALPVLVVTKVKSSETATLRNWVIPVLTLSLDAPEDWQGQISGQNAVFTSSGSFEAVLTISQQDNVDDSTFLSEATSSGSAFTLIPFLVESKRAVRIVDTFTGSERVRVDRGASGEDPKKRTVLEIVFTPNATETERKSQSALFLKLIHSLKFSLTAKSSSVSSVASAPPLPLTASGSAAQPFQACGGPAGILCPSGYFCNVSDLELNIGTCKKLH